jgi:hypothetical protein
MARLLVIARQGSGMRRFVALLFGLLTVAACSSGGSAPTAQSGAVASPLTSAAASALPSTEASSRPESTPAATPLPGCLPLCLPGMLTRPGPLPTGEYKSKYFFGGQLTVTVPDATWSSGEDSTGELKLQPPDSGKTLDFWLDIYPIVDGSGEPVVGFDGTASGLLDWIAANPNISVIHRGPGTLGGLKAEIIDYEASPKAKNVDPGYRLFKRCVSIRGLALVQGRG